MDNFFSIIKEFYDSFNNREISTIIWIAFIFCLLMLSSKNENKKSFKGTILQLIRVSLQPYLIVHFSFLAVFLVGECLLLYKINFWDISLLKDSLVFFFILGGVSISWGSNSNKEPNFLKKLCKDVLKINIISVLLNFYTFSLFTELIIVPAFTLVYLLILIAQMKKESHGVAKLLLYILNAMGFLILYFTLKELIGNYQKVLTISEWRSELLPIILTFLSIPAIYCTTLLARYDMAFRMTSFGYKKRDKKFNWKFQLIKECWFRLSKIEKYNQIPWNEKWDISSTEDFLQFIKSRIK